MFHSDLKREAWCESNLIYFFLTKSEVSLSPPPFFFFFLNLISNCAKKAKMSLLCWWIHFRHLHYHSGRLVVCFIVATIHKSLPARKKAVFKSHQGANRTKHLSTKRHIRRDCWGRFQLWQTFSIFHLNLSEWHRALNAVRAISNQPKTESFQSQLEVIQGCWCAERRQFLQ